jgi:hypothetical protein
MNAEIQSFQEDKPLWMRLEGLGGSFSGAVQLLSEACTLVRNAEGSLVLLNKLREERDLLLERCTSLEKEHLRLQTELAASAEPARLAMEGLEARIRSLQDELESTRLSLTEERDRRNRAISLIRPRSLTERDMELTP